MDMRAFKRTWFYVKKKTKRYREQDSEKVSLYNEEIKDISKENLIYVDESGFEQYYYREHCYCLKGQTVTGKVSGKKFARKSIVAGQVNGKVIAPIVYNGTMDYIFFEQWVEECLIPETKPDDVIILDNASFHRKKQLSDICKKYGRNIIFLPPYSPDLNPIEKTWARIKKILRGIANKFDTLEDAICYTFSII